MAMGDSSPNVRVPELKFMNCETEKACNVTSVENLKLRPVSVDVLLAGESKSPHLVDVPPF